MLTAVAEYGLTKCVGEIVAGGALAVAATALVLALMDDDDDVFFGLFVGLPLFLEGCFFFIFVFANVCFPHDLDVDFLFAAAVFVADCEDSSCVS